MHHRAVLGILVLALAPASAAPERGSGVVIEKVQAGWVAERAGVRPGDLLLTWEQPGSSDPAGGRIESPFDFREIEIERATRGPVTLHGIRDNQPLALLLPSGDWGLQARPRLEGAALERYVQAVRRMEGGDKEEAARGFQGLADGAGGSGDIEVALWLGGLAGRCLGEAGRWEESRSQYQSSAKQAGTAKRPSLVAALRLSEGNLAFKSSRYEAAGAAYRDALAILEAQAPDSLTLGQALLNLGRTIHRQGDLAAAEDLFTRALALHERVAPDSLPVAHNLNDLGNVAKSRGDLAAATEAYQGSRRIIERVAPETLMMTTSLNNLANVAFDRGDLGGAEALHRRALEINERFVPGGLEVARSLNNLGSVFSDRGDLATAEDLVRRSLQIRQRLAPGSLEVATSLTNLGRHARLRWDLPTAETLLKQGLEIRERLAPGSLTVAGSLLELGIAAAEGGDLVAGEDYFRRVLEIHEQQAPGSLDVAMALNALGITAWRRRDLEAAESYHRRALEIRERLAPAGLDVASSLHNLGLVVARRGELEAARSLYKRALGIQTRLAPGSQTMAETAADLGRTHGRLGDKDAAVALLRQSVDALEAQEGRLGGLVEDRATFRADNMDIYRDAVGALLDLGRRTEAFHMLERSRARALLLLLAERDLRFAADVPQDLERDRRQAAADYDRTLAELGRLSAGSDTGQVERLLADLQSLRRRLGEIREALRDRAPRLAALRDPTPLDLAGARRALDPGTLLVAYSIAETRTHLFIVGAKTPLRVETLPLGRDRIAEEVRELRRSIEESASDVTRAEEARRRGEALYRSLVEPAAAEIEPARRLLLVPDGPLHGLPFAALARPGRGYLVEWKPLHVAVSATVYAEVRKAKARKAAAGKPTLLAFGDPRYPVSGDPATAQDATGSVPAAGRSSLAPLPATREEVETIAGLYGGAARVLLGARATEEEAKRSGPEARILHFAAHAVMDQRFPLDSAILLSTPDGDRRGTENGLLQAWEIFEGMRLDSDLVTLSACETALGQELAGEGMIGLTRAFQYAGARSILASLWSVSDRSTAELMKRFYLRLKEGQPKDEALRAAQIDLIHGVAPPAGEDPGGRRGVGRLAKGAARPPSRYAAPFYWAAFQVIGDPH